MKKGFSRKELLATGGLAVVAVALCVCAHYEQRFPGDLRLAHLVQSVRGRTLDSLMQWASYLGGGWRVPVLIIAASVPVWRYVGKREAVLVLLTWLSSPMASGLKLLIGRPRPTADLVVVSHIERDNSFPSGHACIAIVFCGMLAYFAATRLQRRNLPVLMPSALAAIVIWIGVSRVYLGAHWPSDVIGGYVVGMLFLTFLVWLDRRWKPRVQTHDLDLPARSDSGSAQPDKPPD